MIKVSQRQTAISDLTGDLEQFEGNVTEHKSYAEARLTVVSWEDLMRSEHEQFTFFALSHFISAISCSAVLVCLVEVMIVMLAYSTNSVVQCSFCAFIFMV